MAQDEGGGGVTDELGAASSHDFDAPHNVSLRAALAARSVMLRMPSIYRQLQTGRAWAWRQRLRPTYESEFGRLPDRIPATAVSHIVDVGGNFGQSIRAFRRIYPNARITSFEPNPQLAKQLRDRFAHDTQVSVQGVALGAEAGTVTLHVPSYNGVPFPGLAAIDAHDAHRWFGRSTIWGYREERFRLEWFDVEVARIDDVISQADLVKIDTEGFEVNVLRGAARLVSECRPAFLIECSETLSEVRTMLPHYDNFELHGAQWIESAGERLNQLFVSDSS